MKKPFMLLATLSFAAALFGSASAQTTVQYWDYWVTQGPAVDEIIAAFEAEHPDITIEKNTIGGGPYNESLDLAMQSDSGPDIFVEPNRENGFLDYVNRGYIYNLSQFEDSETFRQGFPNPQTNFVEGSNIVNGNLYSAPFAGPDKPWLQLYVNTDLYKEAGLVDADGNPVLPTTWEEFVANSRTVTENTDAYGTGFSMQQPWAAGWWYRVCNYSGVPYDGLLSAFDYRTGEFTFSSNECYKTVLNDLVMMSDEELIHPASTSLSVDDEGARALFAEGGFAHLVAGEWVIAGWEQTHPDFTSYTATHLPFPEGETESFFGATVGGHWFAINANTDVPEAAWEFFKFLHSPEAGAIWARNGNGLVLSTPQPYDEFASNAAFEYVFNSSDLVRTLPEPTIRTPALAEVQQTLIGPSPDDIMVGVLSGQVTDIDAALTDLDARKMQALTTGLSDAQAAGVDVAMDGYVFPDWNPTENYVTEPAN